MAPDVYALPYDSIVEQAIEAAGGFTDDANTDVVNQAQRLSDGAQVHIPAKSETTAGSKAVVSTPTVPESWALTPAAGGSSDRINLNSATPDQLESLPGIGPALAQRILDYRAIIGRFDTIEQIMDVSGIGEVKFEQVRDLITTGGE
jgi:competence protein ComEA